MIPTVRPRPQSIIPSAIEFFGWSTALHSARPVCSCGNGAQLRNSVDSLRVWCAPPLRPSALEIEQQLSRSFRTPPILITLMRRLRAMRTRQQGNSDFLQDRRRQPGSQCRLVQHFDQPDQGIGQGIVERFVGGGVGLDRPELGGQTGALPGSSPLALSSSNLLRNAIHVRLRRAELSFSPIQL